MFNLPQHDFNPVPTPTLTPTEVVCLQLDALQNNDLMPADEGIRMAYRFASPAVKCSEKISPSSFNFSRFRMKKFKRH